MPRALFSVLCALCSVLLGLALTLVNRSAPEPFCPPPPLFFTHRRHPPRSHLVNSSTNLEPSPHTTKLNFFSTILTKKRFCLFKPALTHHIFVHLRSHSFISGSSSILCGHSHSHRTTRFDSALLCSAPPASFNLRSTSTTTSEGSRWISPGNTTLPTLSPITSSCRFLL